MPDRYYRVVVLIGGGELVAKAQGLLEERGIAGVHIMKGQGTASSDLMSIFGLGSSDKSVLSCLAEKSAASGLLRLFRKRLYLGMPNTGVAFTIPVSGGSQRLFEYIDTNNSEVEKDMSEDHDFCMIVAIVNQGFSDEVMNAARPAGARGGTVLHSRRLESDKAKQLWHISIQEEREMVTILCRHSRKKEIMEAINAACGVDSAAQGVVFSLPIADIEGIG